MNGEGKQGRTSGARRTPQPRVCRWRSRRARCPASFPPLHLVNPRNLSPQGARDWSYPSVVVWKNEEKGSDVSLGARMVFDRCNGAYDIAVIVSNDSDLLEPVRLVVQELGLPVYAILPANDRTKRQRRKSEVPVPGGHQDCGRGGTETARVGVVSRPTPFAFRVRRFVPLSRSRLGRIPASCSE